MLPMMSVSKTGLENRLFGKGREEEVGGMDDDDE
jgi:hypothetical protein